MKSKIEMQKLLITRYEELRIKNSSDSRRAFSRRLGLRPGAICEIFNGQWQVSRMLAIINNPQRDVYQLCIQILSLTKKVNITTKGELK